MRLRGAQFQTQGVSPVSDAGCQPCFRRRVSEGVVEGEVGVLRVPPHSLAVPLLNTTHRGDQCPANNTSAAQNGEYRSQNKGQKVMLALGIDRTEVRSPQLIPVLTSLIG